MACFLDKMLHQQLKQLAYFYKDENCEKEMFSFMLGVDVTTKKYISRKEIEKCFFSPNFVDL